MGAYRGISEAHPCPRGHPTCGPASSRPQRAVWWYGLFGPHDHAQWAPINASAIANIVDWCVARHVNELYVDQFDLSPVVNSTAPPSIQASWQAFVHATE